MSSPPTRRTKIVATLGPASASESAIQDLVDAGMDVARLNASHGEHAFFEQCIQHVQAAAARADRYVAILLDLRGPKIRVGDLAESPRPLQVGSEVVLVAADSKKEADEHIPVTYPLAKDVKEGDTILLDDGLLELNVVKTRGKHVHARVVEGGPLYSRKGINVPGRALSAPALSDKDRDDLTFGLKLGVDYVALSFVRRKEDIEQLRAEIERRESDVPIIAKIEKPQALDAIDQILDVSDGIMVARGDLGVEVAPERVPGLQKQLIAQANRRGLPVITATQMLESMIQHARPTRAEASDVANAIFDGTDAVMLSGETAVGQHPRGSVRMMARIATEAEAAESVAYYGDEILDGHGAAYAMAKSAAEVAADLDSSSIVVYTLSGRTARTLSRLRPRRPILALCPEASVCRRLMLYHGVFPLEIGFGASTDMMLEKGDRLLLARGLVQPGERVVVLGGTTTVPGATNLLQIRRIGNTGD